MVQPTFLSRVMDQVFLGGANLAGVSRLLGLLAAMFVRGPRL
jgi:hypothetical protein